MQATAGLSEATRGEDFQRSGWGLLPGFARPHELRWLREEAAAVLARPMMSCMDRRGNDLASLRWDEPIVHALLSDTRRIEMLSGVLGAPDLKWISGYISSKAPDTPPLWWHQDWWCWGHDVSYRDTASQIAVLCYLSDANETSGALRVLPGSHRHYMPLHDMLPEPHGDEANRLALDHPAMSDAPDQVTMRVQAGDAVALDYRLLHGTHANLGNLRRDAILLSVTPNWTGLPADIRGHLISHPALPCEDETPAARAILGDLLPDFRGLAKDLPVQRLRPRR